MMSFTAITSDHSDKIGPSPVGNYLQPQSNADGESHRHGVQNAAKQRSRKNSNVLLCVKIGAQGQPNVSDYRPQ
jgi:hypothetical protein